MNQSDQSPQPNPSPTPSDFQAAADTINALPSHNRLHTSVACDRRDQIFLHNLHGRRGTLQQTLTILLTKLCNELRKHNITDYDSDRYERLVAGATIVLGFNEDERITALVNPTGSLAALTTEGVNRNDSGRGSGVAREPEESPKPRDHGRDSTSEHSEKKSRKRRSGAEGD